MNLGKMMPLIFGGRGGGSSNPPGQGNAPNGYIWLKGADGAFLTGADGAYLYGVAA